MKPCDDKLYKKTFVMTNENQYLVNLMLQHWWEQNYGIILKSNKEQGAKSWKQLEEQ